MPTQKDPTTFGYQNFFSTTLTGDITAGTLTIGLATVPTPTSGILVIEPDSTSSREIILYTSKGASTVTCPADGRGWSGSTAAPHLQGSTVIMAPVDEWFEGLADGTLSTDPLRTDILRNGITSGGVVAQSAGLVGTFSNIVFYLNGQRYSGTSIANKTYTASKDTYVDITATSGGAVSVTYTEVANGATAPALAANYIRVAKVVTNGSAITSVTQGGQDDSIGNSIYPSGILSGATLNNPYKFFASGTGTASIGAGVSQKAVLTVKQYDTNNNFNFTTGVYTAPVSGYYMFSATGRIDTGATTSFMQTLLVKNNSTTVAKLHSSMQTASLQLTGGGSCVCYLAAGETMQLNVYNNAGTSTVQLGDCQLSGFLVSRA